ncbi:MAG: putative MAP kinase kinase family domain protein, partial [Streblomastix strix]
LGRGQHGEVFLVRRHADQGCYCLKKIFLSEVTEEEQAAAINEVTLLSHLESPYVIRYYDSFLENDTLHIIMEYAPYGTLSDLIDDQKSKSQNFSEVEIWRFFLQLCLGLQHIHSHSILHRDIKALNIFIGTNQIL